MYVQEYQNYDLPTIFSYRAEWPARSKNQAVKVLFTDRYKWQNVCLSFLSLANNCVESIYKNAKD